MFGLARDDVWRRDTPLSKSKIEGKGRSDLKPIGKKAVVILSQNKCG
jgi:hypothetical protein